MDTASSSTVLPCLDSLFVECSNFSVESSVEGTQQVNVGLLCSIIALLDFSYFKRNRFLAQNMFLGFSYLDDCADVEISRVADNDKTNLLLQGATEQQNH